ncbi:MAG: hypothetical protein ACR2OI_04615, partial [Acidimicrobiia bacterium]
ERVTDEDIRIRATTERGIPVPTARFRPRPLAAGAIGFGLAMTLLGVVLVVDRLFGAGVSDVGNGGGTGALPVSGQGSPWLFIPVVFGLGLLATGVISTRRDKGDLRERGEELMQTVEKVEAVQAPYDPNMTKIKKRNRRLGWLAGILAAAVIGLGAWLIVELTAASEPAGFDSLPAEVQAAYNGYSDGWASHNGVEALSFATDDYQFVSNGRVSDRAAQAQAITAAGVMDFRVEVLDGMVTGDGPYYLTQTERIHMTGAPEVGYPGISVYTLVNVDGTWKVQRHHWAGDI